MSKIYRKIWEQHYGKIPLDKNGRTYEIHHIDGNKNNNNIENLKCLSIEEHYKIHYEQKDWTACLRMSSRMNISPEEKSLLAKMGSCGKMFITNGVQDKLIQKNSEIPDGWIKGRSKGKRFGKRSDEFRKKMSEIKKGKPLSEAHKKSLVGLVRGMSGKSHTLETRLKQSLASKGKPKSEKHIQNMKKSKQRIADNVCN